ncbi:hypothetical protein [Chitinophaga sp. 212800010-3]|uniref:hypothetical protein n=1 Tax=unclassified Chitinophaga TaxID=2619133 RepID=UPI002DE98220|nr:hypothetical protein [Chitinophaga sp. 212800010-3]
MKKALLAVSIVVSLYACDTGKKYYIDNPTNAPLKVVLDGANIDVAPKEYKRVQIKPGAHQVSVAGGPQRSFTIGENEFGKGGMINPLGAKYVVWAESYTAKGAPSTAPNFTIEWNGQKIQGPFTIDSSIYMINNWWYDVVTPFPKSVEVPSNSASARVTKIFRPDDFTREYNEMIKEGGQQQH